MNAELVNIALCFVLSILDNTVGEHWEEHIKTRSSHVRCPVIEPANMFTYISSCFLRQHAPLNMCNQIQMGYCSCKLKTQAIHNCYRFARTSFVRPFFRLYCLYCYILIFTYFIFQTCFVSNASRRNLAADVLQSVCAERRPKLRHYKTCWCIL